MNRSRNVPEIITTDTKETQNIIGECFENLYYNKLDNLKEMDNFLGSANLAKLNQEEINNLDRPVRRLK